MKRSSKRSIRSRRRHAAFQNVYVDLVISDVIAGMFMSIFKCEFGDAGLNFCSTPRAEARETRVMLNIK